MVDFELPLGAGDAADLAATAALGDELAPARGGEWDRTGAPVVRRAHPLPKRGLAQQRSERGEAVCGAGAAQSHQVGTCGRAGLVDLEQVERPRPLEAAPLAGPTAALEDGGASAAAHVQAIHTERTFGRSV